jgi:fatty-acyl-CoA synthase
MDGLMMDFPLTLTHFLNRAIQEWAPVEVVSRNGDGSLHRYTIADFHRRTQQLAAALTRLGMQPGDRVATLCFNHHRHLEAYFAIPCSGAVLHTLNLRLHHDELAYIGRTAGDRILIVDRRLMELAARFISAVPSIEHVIVVNEPGESGSELDYETLLAAETGGFQFPGLQERQAASICFTSGTTGLPKGVVYSHRSMVLHTLVECMADALALTSRDAVMPAVPMFHANAWGIPYAAVATGARLVLPGCRLDPTSLLDLMAAERVTVAAGVPTIWLGILDLLDRRAGTWDLSALRYTAVGGSAAPRSMIDGFASRHGIEVLHVWGMTEMSPLGTIARVKGNGLSDQRRLDLMTSQGCAVPLVELRHVRDDGTVLPRDGASTGELEVRGPWVASAYLDNQDPGRFTADGWFKTGDVVTLDAQGYMRITDRAKDVIKSGGEWISSVELENHLMGNPSVLEAAVFAGKHPRWMERPIAAVVLRDGSNATEQQLRDFLKDRVAPIWIPDLFIFVSAIPRTSTGKFQKTRLRELYGDALLITSPARTGSGGSGGSGGGDGASPERR